MLQGSSFFHINIAKLALTRGRLQIKYRNVNP
jgi:hypothetical protein